MHVRTTTTDKTKYCAHVIISRKTSIGILGYTKLYHNDTVVNIYFYNSILSRIAYNI